MPHAIASLPIYICIPIYHCLPPEAELRRLRASLQRELRAIVRKHGPGLGDIYDKKELRWDEILRQSSGDGGAAGGGGGDAVAEAKARAKST